VAALHPMVTVLVVLVGLMTQVDPDAPQINLFLLAHEVELKYSMMADPTLLMVGAET